jgi:hypothetical protein
MSVNNVQPKTSFFKRLGNWFGKNAGTMGQVMQATGTTAMGVGMTAAMFHEMNKPTGSIFNYGMCGCNSMFGGMGMFGGMFGGSMFGMNPMMGSMFGMNSMMNPMGTMYGGSWMGQSMAYQMGQQARLYDMQNPYNQSYYPYYQFSPYNQQYNLYNNPSQQKETWKDDITKLDNKGQKLAAGEGDSSDGESFDKETDNIDEKITLTSEGEQEAIKNALIEKGKNTVAFLDANRDGYVDKTEFLANERNKSEFNMAAASMAFDKMNLNKDSYLDYTEFSSMYAVFSSDHDGENTPTGSITKENYNKWSEALGEADNSQVVKRAQAEWKYLFKPESG